MKAKRRLPRAGASKMTPEARTNEMFEKYYQGQNIVPPGEWDDFLNHLRQDLPITFRVTGFRGQNKELARLIESQYRTQLGTVIKATNDDAADELNVKFDCLDWYPDKMAWQLTTDRLSLRKNEHLKALHQFLVSETESGNISRQEAVSMLPPLLLNIKSHHAVLDMCAAPGSKSAQLVELMHGDAEQRANSSSSTIPSGCVIANEVDQKRSFLLTHQVKRLASPCVLITQEDGTCYPRLFLTPPPPASTSSHDERIQSFSASQSSPTHSRQLLFNRILADVPCSGDGTLRKNPDLWLRWHPNLGLGEHLLQTRILRRGLEMLADPSTNDSDRSRLVYSTCTFNPVENEAVIATLLDQCQGSVQLVDLESDPQGRRLFARQQSADGFVARPGLTKWRVMTRSGNWYDTWDEVPADRQKSLRPSLFPPANVDRLQLERCRRIVPHDQNTGGFFVAVLEKVATLPWMKSSSSTTIMNSTATTTTSSKLIDGNECATVGGDGGGGDTLADDGANDLGKGKDDDAESNRQSPPPVKRSRSEEKEVKDKIAPINPKSNNGRGRVFNTTKAVFHYLDSESDDWIALRDYYRLDVDNQSPQFQPTQLFYRTESGDGDLAESSSRHRHLYYTNQLIKSIIQANSHRAFKIVHAGVKLFALMTQDKQFSGYRFLQDGVDLVDTCLLPIDNWRRIHLGPGQLGDLKMMLEEEMPLADRMTESTQSQWLRLTPGPVLIDYQPPALGHDEASIVDMEQPRCRLAFTGWRGLKSLRHYIGRHERLHYMRLACLDPGKPLIEGKTTTTTTDDS